MLMKAEDPAEELSVAVLVDPRCNADARDDKHNEALWR
jgi:hypothetical protein